MHAMPASIGHRYPSRIRYRLATVDVAVMAIDRGVRIAPLSTVVIPYCSDDEVRDKGEEAEDRCAEDKVVGVDRQKRPAQDQAQVEDRFGRAQLLPGKHSHAGRPRPTSMAQNAGERIKLGSLPSKLRAASNEVMAPANSTAPGQVDVAVGRGLGWSHLAEQDDEDDDADRHVDQEDLAPRPVLDDEAAQVRSDDAAERKDAAEEPDHAVPIVGELARDDAGRRGQKAAAAERLEHAAADQHIDIGRQAAQQRAEREQEHAHQKDPHATERLAELAGQRHDRGLRQGIARERPAQPDQRRLQVGHHVRQRHGHDGAIDREHQQAEPRQAKEQIGSASLGHGLSRV